MEEVDDESDINSVEPGDEDKENGEKEEDLRAKRKRNNRLKLKTLLEDIMNDSTDNNSEEPREFGKKGKAKRIKREDSVGYVADSADEDEDQSDTQNDSESSGEGLEAPSSRKRTRSGRTVKRIYAEDDSDEDFEPSTKRRARKAKTVIKTKVREEESLSEYELIRQKNILERQKMFEQLDFGSAKASVLATTPKAGPSKRGLAASKPKMEAGPVRQSLRLQKLDAETGLKLPEKEPTMYNTVDNHPPLPFEDLELDTIANLNGDDDEEDAEILEEKRKFLDTISNCKVGDKGRTSFGEDFNETEQALSNIDIKDDQVAKVVPERIFSMAVHPTEDKVIVAAGDKTGSIGIWDVKDKESDNHGVHVFKVFAS